MPLLEFIRSLVNTVLNWFLAKQGRDAEHTREQDIKLKRLLYHLLELKSWIEKEVFLDQHITKFLTLYENAIANDLPDGVLSLEKKRPWMIKQIKKVVFSVDKYSVTASNIETILIDLSEIDPLFAFQLSGIYNITEKMNILKSYLNDSMEQGEDSCEGREFIFEDVLRPQLVNDVFVQIQQDILKVAKMIDKKTYEKIISMNTIIPAAPDEAEFKRFMAPVLKKLRKSAYN